MLLEKKPDLTIKNKKSQTAIDITNSKTIISTFWHHLTGSSESNTSEDNKALVSKSPTPGSQPKANFPKKTTSKLVLADLKSKPKGSADAKVLKTSKDLIGSETSSTPVFFSINNKK